MASPEQGQVWHVDVKPPYANPPTECNINVCTRGSETKLKRPAQRIADVYQQHYPEGGDTRVKVMIQRYRRMGGALLEWRLKQEDWM